MDSDNTRTDDAELIEMLRQLIMKLSEKQKHDLINYIRNIPKKNEKRKSGRKYFKISVDYSIKDKFYTDTLENVSTKGAFIRTTRPIEIGDSITMIAPIPGMEKNVKMKGKVVRRSKEGVGVDFFEEHKEILSYTYFHFWET